MADITTRTRSPGATRSKSGSNVVNRVFERMGFGRRPQTEVREFPTEASAVTPEGLLEYLGYNMQTDAGIILNHDTALQIPAVWAAINFLPGTIAGLPLHVFKKKRDGSAERQRGPVDRLLNNAVNDEQSSYDFWKLLIQNALHRGRGLAYIERNANETPRNLYFMEPEKTSIGRSGGRKYYEWRSGQKTVRYDAKDVIDIPFMLKPDGLLHYDPIMVLRNTLAMAIAANAYGAKVFNSGGMPPLVLQGPLVGEASMARAAADTLKAAQRANRERKAAFAIPAGHELKELGFDPNKMQMTELSRFLIEEIARIYQLPPTFLQDLTHGTFSNTEQQDLHFVKHTLSRWVEQIEGELNLKLFGRSGSRPYCEFNVDGLLRGDFKTRMDGYKSAIMSGHMSPQETRDRENLPAMGGKANKLFIQGATVPLDSQDGLNAPAASIEDTDDEDDD